MPCPPNREEPPSAPAMPPVAPVTLPAPPPGPPCMFKTLPPDAVPPTAFVLACCPPAPPFAVKKLEPNVETTPLPPLPPPEPPPEPPPPPPATVISSQSTPAGVVYVPEPVKNDCTVGAISAAFKLVPENASPAPS